MAKLTVSVDKEIAELTKQLAKEGGTSVSAMFARYVRAMAQKKTGPIRGGHIARQALGLIKLPKDKSYRDILVDALMEKYELK